MQNKNACTTLFRFTGVTNCPNKSVFQFKICKAVPVIRK